MINLIKKNSFFNLNLIEWFFHGGSLPQNKKIEKRSLYTNCFWQSRAERLAAKPIGAAVARAGGAVF